MLISPGVDGRFGATAVFGIPEADRTDEVLAERIGVSLERPRGRPRSIAGEQPRATVEARGAIRYKADDFSISRQRSWGTPIPIVYCEEHGAVPLPKEQLPVLLPLDITPTGAGNPLAELASW